MQVNDSGLRHAFILQTHICNWAIFRQFRKFQRETHQFGDAWFLYQAETIEKVPDEIKPHSLLCTWADVKTFNPDITRLLPGNTHIPALHFYKNYPDYDYYWISEYDVRFSGNWETIVKAFLPIKADFVASHLCHYREKPEWMLWGLTHPTDHIPQDEHLRCFSPFYRVSNQGWQVMLDAYLDGWRGHSETLFPTIIHRAGLTIADFGGDNAYVPDGMKNRFYSEKSGRFFTNTFRDRPSFFEFGLHQPNKLYHPVKSLRFYVNEKKILLRRYFNTLLDAIRPKNLTR